MMCDRRSRDPLLRLFLKDRVNLLAVPRLGLAPGMVFAVQGNLVECMPAADAIEGTLAVESFPAEPTALEAVAKTVTSDLALEAGASFLGMALAAVGLGSDDAKLRATLGGKGVDVTTFKLLGLAIHRTRIVPLAESLKSCRLKELPAPFTDRTQLYVCTGTWAAKGIEMKSRKEGGQMVEASADLNAVVEAGGKLDIKKGFGTETVISAKDRVVFGVEVMRVEQVEGNLRLADVRPERMLRGEEPDSDPDALAVMGEEAFLRLGQP